MTLPNNTVQFPLLHGVHKQAFLLAEITVVRN